MATNWFSLLKSKTSFGKLIKSAGRQADACRRSRCLTSGGLASAAAHEARRAHRHDENGGRPQADPPHPALPLLAPHVHHSPVVDELARSTYDR
jgi:hypothetical protein